MNFDIYRNLHRNKLTIKETGGKVIGYADALVAVDAVFNVSEAGRQRTLASGHKNVHAVIRCHSLSDLVNYTPKEGSNRRPYENPYPPTLRPDSERVTYDPRKYSSFVWADTEHPIYRAPVVIVEANGAMYA